MERVIVFGTGQLFQTFLPFIHSNYEIIALSDNNVKLHGSIQNGIEVINPATIGMMDFDFIIVASMYFDEINSQLITLGVSDELIRSVYDDSSINAAVARYLIAHPEFESARAKISSLSDVKNKLIVMNSLGNGGAERALLNLCRRLDDKEKIFVIVIEGGGEYFNILSQLVSVIEIFSSIESRLLSRCFFMFFSAREICSRLFGRNKYDIAIAYIEGLSTYLVSGINSIYKVACVHANLRNHHVSAPYYASLKAECDAYTNIDHMIFVSDSVKHGFNERIGWQGCESSIIGNVFDIETITRMSNMEMENDSIISSPYIVAVGRLVEVKGFDRLICAFAKIKINSLDNIKLVIIGDGPMKSALSDLIYSLGMKDHIILLGNKKNPYPYIKSAQCLVSSSLSEGHPLAIGEAIILGIPIIATNCEGNSGMVEYGSYGYLCDNSESGLVSALTYFLNSPMHQAVLQFKSVCGQGFLSGHNEVEKWNEIINKSMLSVNE